MIILWISLLPSKRAKILESWAVSAGQWPEEPSGISTESARPVRDECRFRVGAHPLRIVSCGRGESAEQRGGDEPGRVAGVKATCCGVFGRSVHEAEGSGGEPVHRQVGSESARALIPLDEVLHLT